MHHQWPQDLVKKMSSLCAPLLAQGSGISLERLQIISVDIAMRPHLTANHAVLVRDVENDTICLSQNLKLADERSCTVTVRYFVRGRRQFFKPVQDANLSHDGAYPSVTSSAIKAFFKALGEDNSALYDQDLAQLMGRRDVTVPTVMLMALGLEYIMKEHEIATTCDIEATFFRAVHVKQQLAIGHRNNEHGHLLQLFADNDLAFSLVVNDIAL